jgi:hypothetical protein
VSARDRIDRLYTAEASRWNDRYGVLFLLIVASLLLRAANTEWLKVAAIVVLGGTTLVAFLVARAGKRAWRIAVVLIPLGVILGILGTLGDARWAQLTAALVSLVLPIVAIGAIGRRIVMDGRVDARTIVGLLCVYLLLGMTFAALYIAIAVASQEPFFAEVQRAEPVDFTYFSYVTLSTVGYGDLTAANPLPKMISALEGLTGQLYLVTVVALAVSRVRTKRDPPGR